MEIISLNKAEAAKILQDYYIARLNTLIIKEYTFQHKYNMLFPQFELYIQQSSRENFEQWDDYMEWKAFRKSIEQLQNLVNAIEHGNFELAS